MRKANAKKRVLLSVLVFSMFSAITAQAAIAITSSQNICQSGTSGSAFYNQAKGTRRGSDISDSLYSGIKRGSSGAYYFGSPAGGNKVYLTANSPSMTGRYSDMYGTAITK